MANFTSSSSSHASMSFQYNSHQNSFDIPRMEGGSRENVRWAESIYWTNFRTFHFSLFLLYNFEDYLDLPVKFSSYLSHQISQSVCIRGPSGVTWNVGLVKNGGTLAFKHGWGQFVRDNSLVETDFLVFKYSGENLFDVLIFNGLSLCEKESTYFVQKKESSTHQNAAPNDVESSSFGLSGYENDDFTTPSTQHNNTFPFPTPTTENAFRKPTTWGSTSRDQNRTTSSVPEHDVMCQKRKSYRKQYVSTRRPVSKQEKMNAMRAAQASATSDSVLIVMRPSCVYKRFFTVIPGPWLKRHVPLEHQIVIVRHVNKTWRVKLYYFKSRRSGGLSGRGWREFALENHLEEFDVCEFRVAPGSNDPIILDVNLFRVVPEITPLKELVS